MAKPDGKESEDSENNKESIPPIDNNGINESIDNNEPKDQDDQVPVKEYDLNEFDDAYQAFVKDNLKEDRIGATIAKNIINLKNKFKLDKYKIIFLFDEYTTLSSSEADRIYEALADFKCDRDILLILNNLGGQIESAYLISQTCKKSTLQKFVVAVPRKAKSAATLLALGADEIHMGLMSELGPIDPQINNLPALGLGNSLEYIAKIVTKYPDSSSMFSQYLSSKLELNVLGYFERVSESATQYAERLLGERVFPNDEKAKSIAEKLVYHYKDHSFVIDIVEAKTLLGEGIIKENTNEYDFANAVYSLFNNINFFFRHVRQKKFTYVGSISSGLRTYTIQ
ncbi:ATP-dependent Clp protease proteolytic subunit [Fibrella sp. ES10-3-2-2]|nr:hypothetical protein A6C57_01145 [Fibrella sp. ES10-3-2-2]